MQIIKIQKFIIINKILLIYFLKILMQLEKEE